MYSQQGYYQGMGNTNPQGMNMQQGMPSGMQPDSTIYPQVQEDRLQFEIRENRDE